MIQGFFRYLLCVLFLYSHPGRCCVVPVNSPHLAVNWEHFPISCKCVLCVCRCDVNCDPLRMDKWQKMWLFPSHPLIPFSCFRGYVWRQKWRRICVSVGLPDATPPRAPGPQRALAPEEASLSQHWQAEAGHSPTEPRGDRAVEKTGLTSTSLILSESCQSPGPKTTKKNSH